MLGIISAIPQEINCVLNAMTGCTIQNLGQRKFYQGLLFNQPVVIVFSNWGKVAAATTTTQMLNSFDIDRLIFTGVAGALQTHLNIGDVIVGTNLYQHDMDARPIFKQFEIPIIRKTSIKTNNLLSKDLQKATSQFLETIESHIDKTELNAFDIVKPTVYKGDIASGDQFIASAEKSNHLNKILPNALCAEMEGAAVAQVCYDYQINFGIVRTISDKCQHTASIDFSRFANQIASQYALGILKEFLR